MIVFIATTQTQDLLRGEDQIWTYCLRREPLQKFIKEQYGKLVTLKPDTFVIDLRAFDSPSDLSLLIQSFQSAKYLIIVPTGQKFRMQHCITFPEGQGLLKYLKEGPQNKKIGIIAEEETDATALTAFQLISCLAEEQNDLCYIEVDKNAKLPNWAEKFHLVKTDYGYEYRSIPFYSNLAKDTEISVFDFGCRDAAKENMFQKCDITLLVEQEKGRKIRIMRQEKEVVIKIPKDPFRSTSSDIFQDLIPEIEFGVTEKKPKKIPRKKSTPKNRAEKVRKKKRIEKVPVVQKKKEKKPNQEPRKRKKIEWKLPKISKPDLEKFREILTRKRLLIIVLALAMLSVSAAGIRIYSAQKKEEKVKVAVQKKQQEQDPDSTVQFSSEKSTKEKSTKEKKDSERPKETTETSVSKASSSYQTSYESTRKTTKQTDSRKTNKKPVTTTRKKKPAATTRKKKPATTTRKPKPTTTRKPKPTTTERFDINYGPE